MHKETIKIAFAIELYVTMLAAVFSAAIYYLYRVFFAILYYKMDNIGGNGINYCSRCLWRCVWQISGTLYEGRTSLYKLWSDFQILRQYRL